MGYLSTYNLEVQGEGTEDLIAQLRAENEEARYAIDNYGCSMDQAKWYESDEDIIAFSAKHPDALFILEMQGEEGERACVFAKGGRSYREESGSWTPDKFDESKLLAPGQLPSEAPKPYTVILLYPDHAAKHYGHDTYMNHVNAATPDAAVTKAKEIAAKDVTGEDGNPEDWFCIACIAGHHTDANA